MLAVSAWHLRRAPRPTLFARSARLALVVLVPAALFAMIVGSHLGVVEDQVPADEDRGGRGAVGDLPALLVLGCSRSAAATTTRRPTKIIPIPHLLSLLATNSWNGQVEGLNELNAQYQQQYGPGNYVPNVFIQYWSMRVMAYTASLVFLFALWGCG